MLIEILDAVVIKKELMLKALEEDVNLSDVINDYSYNADLLRHCLRVSQEHPVLFNIIELAYYTVHPIENIKTAEYCDRVLRKN